MTTPQGHASPAPYFDWISDDEIKIYEPLGYSEADAWKAVADKWRKAALMAQANCTSLRGHVERISQ